MSAFVSQRRGSSDTPVNPILDAMRRWKIAPLDMLWAIEKGAWKPNDRRTRALIGAAQIAGARLKPWDGHWSIQRARTPEGVLLEDAVDHALRVLRRLRYSVTDAQIASLWEYDISNESVRKELASRIWGAGLAVVPTEGTKHRLSVDQISSLWEYDLSRHDDRIAIARRIVDADLAVIRRI